MAALLSTILFLLLEVLVSGKQENAETSLDETTRASVSRAVHWLNDQRVSWGPFTPRALVALSLSQEVVPISKDEMTIMKKQLFILLSLELEKNSSTGSMELSRLALYVNALYATCQDPRNFHGLDLVRILRTRTDAALATDFSLPVVFIPLCIAQEIRDEDVHRIMKMYHDHRNQTDLQALTLLGLSCIAQQNRSSAIRQYKNSLAADFARHFHAFSQSRDVYTLALSLQVLRAASIHQVDPSLLIEKQSPDGSFGSLLAAYYALPALLGRNIYDIQCDGEGSSDNSLSYPLSESNSPKVYYSVWMGEGDAQDSRSVALTLPSNGTFLDVMEMAQFRNPNFRFKSEVSNRSRHVYSIGGIPNDAQREMRWILFKTKGEPDGFHPHRSLPEVTKGVDQIHPAADDHFIFWFRRHSPYRV